MAEPVSATIRLESGAEFEARIANLTPSTVFVQTLRPLAFRERVTVTLLSVSVVGVVVHASRDPGGVVIALGASAEQRVQLEDQMDAVATLWPGAPVRLDRGETLEHIIPAPAVTERHEMKRVDSDLSQPVAIPPSESDEDTLLPRLRATTVVGERNPEDFVEEPTDNGLSS